MDEFIFDEAKYLASCEADGINRAKTFVSLNFLPESGKFIGWENKSKGTAFAHTDVITSGGGHISVAALSAQYNDSNSRENVVKFVDSKTKAEYYGLSTVSHSPAFTGDPKDILKAVIGKSFTAKPVVGYISKFTEADKRYQTPESVVIVPKAFYLVTILN